MKSSVSVAMTGRVAIVQLGFTGHRLSYVRTLVDAAAETCPVLLVTSEEAVGSREMALHLGAYIDTGRIEVYSIESVASTSRTIPKLTRTLRSFGATRLVLLDGDRQVLGVAARCRVRFPRKLTLAALIMRTPLASTGGLRERGRAGVKMALLRLAKLVGGRQLDLYFLTDSFASTRNRPGYPGLVAVPDPPQPHPLVDRRTARANFAFDDGDFVVGLLGAQNESKNPDLVLSVATSRAKDIRVLVAGPYDDWTATQVATAQSAGARITVERGYLTAHDLAVCIGACDAVALTYDLDAPSGFLVSAYLAGVPVIAAGSRWIGRVVADKSLGVVCDLDKASIERAIDALIDRRSLDHETVAHPIRLANNSFARSLLGSSNLAVLE